MSRRWEEWERKANFGGQKRGRNGHFKEEKICDCDCDCDEEIMRIWVAEAEIAACVRGVCFALLSTQTLQIFFTIISFFLINNCHFMNTIILNSMLNYFHFFPHYPRSTINFWCFVVGET